MKTKAPIYKYRLFVKIYLWFWLVTIVMVATVVIVDRMNRPEPPEFFRHMVSRTLNFYGQTALGIMERDGVEGLNGYFRHIQDTMGNRLFLFDGNRLVNNDKPADGVIDLMSEVLRGDDLNRTIMAREGVAAKLVKSKSGKVYVIVQKMPPPPHPSPPPFNKPGSFILLQIMAAMLASGIVCYCLARYMISPIVKLENATRELASGNLSVRVSKVIGGRKDEIAQLAQGFDTMAERIESLLVSQRNLLRDISHELRSPLARMNVALELCRKQCNPETEKTLDRISRESEKLNELIGQILTLNRADSGVSGLDVTSFSLALLVREVVEDADFEARTCKRSVVITACDECMIRGDRHLLQSAVENVVRNAVLYTAENTQVEVSLLIESKESASSAILSVRDHGPGVPEEEIVNLFKPFYRINNGKAHRGGAGIGLTIAETAVRIHGGEIKIANAVSGGVAVEIRIPVA
jgi:signal transduction histidine kinase